MHNLARNRYWDYMIVVIIREQFLSRLQKNLNTMKADIWSSIGLLITVKLLKLAIRLFINQSASPIDITTFPFPLGLTCTFTFAESFFDNRAFHSSWNIPFTQTGLQTLK